jgi:hypothetical protein
LISLSWEGKQFLRRPLCFCRRSLAEDAARFIGHMGPWRQVRPHWDYAAELVLIASITGQEADIERATAQMERYGVTIGCDDAARFLFAR